MLKNYFKTALRNIIRHKGFSLINIVGLAIGMTGCIAILLWVSDELSYDRFHKNAKNIQRIYRTVENDGRVRILESTSSPIAPTLKQRYPEIKEFVRTYSNYSRLEYGTESNLAQGLAVDPSFLEVFTFDIIDGDKSTALQAANSIILTESLAHRLFGNDNPIGKTLKNGTVVTALAAAPPPNSSIEFEYLMPFKKAIESNQVVEEWFYFTCDTYLLLEDNANAETMGAKIKDLFSEQDETSSVLLYIQPLSDVYLKGLQGMGRIVYVYVFSVVAALLLAVACINFMNLSTARSAKRAKEIGLRKTIGATRTQLVAQIMIESIIQTILAAILAISLLQIILPSLANFFGRELYLDFSSSLIVGIFSVSLVTALLSGSYPALILSSFRPASVLKRTTTGTDHGGMSIMRKILVVFQFTISTGLVFAALVVYLQMDMINTKDIGIERDNIVVVTTDGLKDDHQAFITELKKHPGITEVSAVFDPPAWCRAYVSGFDFDGMAENQNLRAGLAFADYNYLDIFGLELVAGRNFSPDFPSDRRNAYIVNESAAEAMHMDSPLGKQIHFDENPGTIIGVVKDFHFASLHDQIGPLIISLEKEYYRRLCIKISDDNIPASLAHIENQFKAFRPGDTFSYRFFDELLGRQYEREQRIGRIVIAFTIITACVACLGLFGLIAYSAERRTKEIGIRKVLGSSISGIVGLLTREFIVLVILSNFISIPISYYIATQWLGNFAYRIDLGWELYAITSITTLLVALLTVSYQAIHAARANPVASLKYE